LENTIMKNKKSEKIYIEIDKSFIKNEIDKKIHKRLNKNENIECILCENIKDDFISTNKICIKKESIIFKDMTKLLEYILLKVDSRNKNQIPENDYENILRRYKLEALNFEKYKKILDVGTGKGSMFLNNYNFYDVSSKHIDVVEENKHSRETCKRLSIFNNVFSTDDKIDASEYEVVTIFGVLEHVDNPYELLKKYKSAKKIFISVPNAMSFHRMLGVELGMIDKESDLTLGDKAIGHKIVFNKESIEKILNLFCEKYNFEIKRSGTLGFKFTNSTKMSLYFSEKENNKIYNIAKRTGLAGENNFTGAELYYEIEKK